MLEQVIRHWHVTERYGRSRLFAPRMRVVLSLGADTSDSAYRAFSRRANELMLEGWNLDVDGCSDVCIAVRRRAESRVVEIADCYDSGCLAARPPTPLGEGRVDA